MSLKDGHLGRCKDILFDDKNWVVRYLVVAPNPWIPKSKKVVISPIAISDVDHKQETIALKMTKDQLKGSPTLDEHAPVSREFEEAMFRYYGYAFYWMGPGLWGTYPHPGPLIDQKEWQETLEDIIRDNHLRSFNEVSGYHWQAKDKTFGHVDNILIKEANWEVQAIVFKISSGFGRGRQVLLAPEYVDEIDAASKSVIGASIDSDFIESCPEYDEAKGLSKAICERLVKNAGKIDQIDEEAVKARLEV